MGGHVEVQNATAVMGQNQENVKNLKADRGHGEEINGDKLLRMILEVKCAKFEKVACGSAPYIC